MPSNPPVFTPEHRQTLEKLAAVSETGPFVADRKEADAIRAVLAEVERLEKEVQAWEDAVEDRRLSAFGGCLRTNGGNYHKGALMACNEVLIDRGVKMSHLRNAYEAREAQRREARAEADRLRQAQGE